MTVPERYARHSPLSDPGKQVAALRALPAEPAALADAIRRVTAHYRATPGVPPERLAEANTRFLPEILGLLAERGPLPPAAPRALEDRFVGCCRDDALLFVARLREAGVPARARVGFATYFTPGFHHDHVVGEYWDGTRWVRADPELDPARFPFDPLDLPVDAFVTAAGAWRAWRRGEIDAERWGVAPGFLTGADFLKGYVPRELAALNGHELLLWDDWGLIGTPLADLSPDDLALLDEAADALLADDDARIVALYEHDARLRVPDVVQTWVGEERRPVRVRGS